MASTAAPRVLQRSGVVVRAGTMSKTVKVQAVKQQWSRRVRKYYKAPFTFLVNDPNNSLIEGDVITAVPEKRTKNVLYTVNSILAPFAKPIEERPPLLSAEEREASIVAKMSARQERREQRREAGIAPAPGKNQKMPKSQKEVQVDDGGAGGGKGPGGRGRVVLPGGLHKFHKVNEEAQQSKRKIENEQHKARENVYDREEVEKIDEVEYQKDALNRK